MQEKNYIPYIPVISIEEILWNNRIFQNKIEVLKKSYSDLEEAFHRYKRGDQLSNNYLKMHGRPMRRRGRVR